MTRFAAASDLVIDLGMNNGDDTAYYLARGHRVAAVEANPTLCARAQQRFAAAIADGRLTIVNAAVAAHAGAQTFYVNRVNDHWSSLDAAWAGREGHALNAVTISGITLAALFAQVGVPLYLKVDVEGADELVLDQLSALATLPQYLSVEDCRFGFRYLQKMAALGYTGFQILDQSTVPQLTDPTVDWRFAAGASGPFGEALPGDWLDVNAIDAHYSRTVRDRNGHRHAARTHWWDIHARGSPHGVVPAKAGTQRRTDDRQPPDSRLRGNDTAPTQTT